MAKFFRNVTSLSKTSTGFASTTEMLTFRWDVATNFQRAELLRHMCRDVIERQRRLVRKRIKHDHVTGNSDAQYISYPSISFFSCLRNWLRCYSTDSSLERYALSENSIWYRLSARDFTGQCVSCIASLHVPPWLLTFGPHTTSDTH